jgi:hypothetical protein
MKNLKQGSIGSILVIFIIVFIFFSGCYAKNPVQTSSRSSSSFSSSWIYPASFTTSDSSNSIDDSNRGGKNVQRTSIQVNNAYSRLVLVNYEIINMLQKLRSSVVDLEELNELKFSLSKRFNLILPLMNNGPLISNDGALISRDQNTKTISFDTNDLGRLRTLIPNAPDSKETLIINFQKDNEIIPLGFKRSYNQDSYVLSSVDINSERYLINYQDGLPYLCIYINKNDTSNIQAVPISTLGDMSRHPSHKNPKIIPSNYIMGSGYVSKRGVIAYVNLINPAVDYQFLNNLIATYIEESAFEGVNHDIAIAQMLYTTNYLKKYMPTFNYAGLSTVGTQGWNGRFPNMRTGVRAHIQHLKGYGSTQPPYNQIVDPRYHLIGVIYGKIRDLDQLCYAWSQNLNYANNVRIILYDMYLYTEENY